MWCTSSLLQLHSLPTLLFQWCAVHDIHAPPEEEEDEEKEKPDCGPNEIQEEPRPSTSGSARDGGNAISAMAAALREGPSIIFHGEPEETSSDDDNDEEDEEEGEEEGDGREASPPLERVSIQTTNRGRVRIVSAARANLVRGLINTLSRRRLEQGQRQARYHNPSPGKSQFY